MHTLRIFPDHDNGLWHMNFDGDKYGIEMTDDAFRGLVGQLVECGLYNVSTEIVLDADDDGEGEDELP